MIQVDEKELYRMISDTYRVTVAVYGHTGVLQERFSPDAWGEGASPMAEECGSELVRLCSETKHPQLVASGINQIWAGVPRFADRDGDTLLSVTVLGPLHTPRFAQSLALDYVRAVSTSLRQAAEMLEAISQTPVIPYDELVKLLSLIFFLISRRTLDSSRLTISGMLRRELISPEELYAEEALVESSERVLGEYGIEEQILECIRQGNLQGLKRLLRAASYMNLDRYTMHHLLRQKEVLYGITVAETTRAAIEGGLNPRVAYHIRDRYIRKAHSARTLSALLRLQREMLYEATIRVSNSKRTRACSKVIQDCCAYIDEHVRERLLVTDIARFAGFHPYYLARRFKEETGKSIKEYIRDAKIAEAKSLLKYTNMSLSEISEALAFSSQSYFTETFKRVVGLTPGQYRRVIEAAGDEDFETLQKPKEMLDY